jgi:hypothetical protein
VKRGNFLSLSGPTICLWHPLASFKTTPSILGESVVFGIDEVLSIP